MERKVEHRLYLLLALILLTSGFVGGYKIGKDDTKTIIETDTLVIQKWDTVEIEKPTEKTRYILRYDTLTKIEFVNITDSALLKIIDSVNAAAIIPIEGAIYQDSTENAQYTAYISGYKANLDSICINCMQKETIITKIEYEKASRFGAGVQIGVGYCGKIAPYVGIGIQYRLWQPKKK